MSSILIIFHRYKGCHLDSILDREPITKEDTKTEELKDADLYLGTKECRYCE